MIGSILFGLVIIWKLYNLEARLEILEKKGRETPPTP